MKRTILFLILGILCTALCGSALSVYIFHDVDSDKIGRSNEAFAGLCTESVVFTLIVGGGVALLTLVGRHLLRLKGHSPRGMLGILLGVGVTAGQYFWDFAARKEFPKLADFSLYLYLIVAIAICTVFILRDNSRQMKLCQARAAPFDKE